MKKFVFLFAVMLSSIFMLCGCSEAFNEIDMEESAIPLVSELLQEAYGDQAAKCLKVEIIEEVTDKHYKAVATLNNGNDINIMIEDRGDQIYVTIPVE